MSRPWADADLHYNKRRLSVAEKSSLTRFLPVMGKALVLPGEPNTEIEELVEVGFNPAMIYGVEGDPDIAESLHLYYRDRTPIYYDEVGYWLSQSTSTFSYMHLDYCGQITRERLTSMQRAMGHLDPVARLRVSVFGSRRTQGTKTFESQVLDATLINMLDFIRGHETGWAMSIADSLQSTFADYQYEDPSALIATILFVNHVMGMSWEQLCDQLDDKSNALPSHRGAHQINGITRYRYTTDNNVMYTTWVDFTPIPQPQISGTEGWMRREILQFAELLIEHAAEPVFLSATT